MRVYLGTKSQASGIILMSFRSHSKTNSSKNLLRLGLIRVLRQVKILLLGPE